MEAILCLSRQLTIKPIDSTGVCLHKPAIISRRVNLSFSHHPPFPSLNLQAWPTHEAHPKTWAINAFPSPKMYGGDEVSKLPGAARLAAAVLIGVLGAMCLRKMVGHPHLAVANAYWPWSSKTEIDPEAQFDELVKRRGRIEPADLRDVVEKLIEKYRSKPERVAKELGKRYKAEENDPQSQVETGLIWVEFEEALKIIDELKTKQGNIPGGSYFASRFEEYEKALVGLQDAAKKRQKALEIPKGPPLPSTPPAVSS